MIRQEGSITVFMLLMILTMLAFTGWVVDAMKSMSIHTQLVNANDAALASAVISNNPEGDSISVGLANMESGVLGHLSNDVQFNYTEGPNTSVLSSELLYQPDGLNRWLSEPYTIGTSSEAASARRTAEIVFMLDVSDSMHGKALEITKKALHLFADKIYSKGGENKNFAVSIVPASGNVNTGWLPEIYLSTFRKYDHKKVKEEQGWDNMFSRKGKSHPVPGRGRKAMCRDISNEKQMSSGQIGLRYFKDHEKHYRFLRRDFKRITRPISPPSTNQFSDGSLLDEAVYPSTNPLHNYLEYREDKAIFDDIECHQNSITPMVTREKDLRQAIDALISGNNTNNAEGMVWAARLLSPYWRGVWRKDRPNLPRNYGDESNSKYIVVFTDGDHLIQKDLRNKKMRLFCTQMKRRQRDVNLIAINFGGSASKRLMQTCSSGPEFYHEASSLNINVVFEQIANQMIDTAIIK